MKKITAVIFQFLVFTLTVTAQDYPVKHINISSGLSNNSATSIFQDSDGYMWFGTFDGLNRYDGHDIKIFRNRIKDSASLPGNAISCIEGDNKNNLWIGCSNGPTVFNKASQTFSPLYYRTSTGKKISLSTNVYKIVNIPKLNTVLVATQEKLIIYEDAGTTGSPVALQGKADYWCQAIAYNDKMGACYIFVNNIGLCLYNVATKKMHIVNKELIQANCLSLAPEGLWVGTDRGAYLYNTARNSYSENYFTENTTVSVRDFLIDGNNTFMATDGNGVYILKNSSNEPQSYNPSGSKELLNSKSVYGLYESKNGEKWFATLRGGISMLGSTPLNFSSFKYEPKDGTKNPENNFMLSFCEDEKKNIWIGTEGAGLRYWDRQNNTYTNYTTTTANGRKIKSDFITGIVKDSVNAIWVAMWKGGVCRIDPKTKAIQNFDIYNPYTKREEPHSWLLFIDSKNTLWLAVTNEGALYRFDTAKNKFICYDHRLKNITCLYETADGKLWGGDLSGNIIGIDTENHTFKRYPLNYTARCMLEDRNKNLWIGTAEGGLLLFNRKNSTFKQFTKNNGLPNNTVLRLLQDPKGNLWMSTYDGICKFNPKNYSIRNYYASDGLQSNQFNWNAGTSLSTGEFIFGGINGFTIFNPAAVKDLQNNGKFLLNELLVANRPLNSSSQYVTARKLGLIYGVKLPYDKSNISFDFVYLDFINSDKVEFAYFLEGWDKEWNYAGKSHRANYSQLHEGTYTFKVKVAHINGRWKMASALVNVTILPPWYRMWWAYCLYSLGIISIIYAYLRYSKNKERLRYEVKLAKLEQKKEKDISERQLSMFTFMAHELRTPLSLIINPLKKVVKSNTNEPEQINDLTIAYKNARRLLSLTDQLLLFRKADGDADELKLSVINLTELCNDIYQFFIYQAKECKHNYNIVMPQHDINVVGDHEKIEIALFNILSNAFKYSTKEGTITIELIDYQNEVSIQVSDTGIGIKDTELETIFEKFRQADSGKTVKKGFGIGLYVAKYFIGKHEGSITCKSKFGKGSTFIITMPKGQKLYDTISAATLNVKTPAIIEGLLTDTVQEDLLMKQDIELMPDTSTTGEFLTSKRSIVVVDDNKDIKDYLVSLFSKNYIVSSAEDGETGLNLIKKLLPDLVLSDIAMGGMDGIELCKAIKQNEELSHIPVILLTATTNPETQLLGLTEGADDYITKPFDDEILLAKVEAMLRGRNQLRRYFLDSITLNEHNNKVPAEFREFLDKCIQTVEANLTNKDFTLKSFSRQMGMSHSSLYKKIKTISGDAANIFIRSIRLRRAAVLLLTENYTIAQVRSQVGIEDSRYFRQQFSKIFGMTPSEYVKKYRNSFNKELNIIIQDEQDEV